MRVRLTPLWVLGFALAILGSCINIAHAESVTVSWGPPVLNTDGTPLTNLTGYRFYVGSSPATLTERVFLGPTITRYVVEDLGPGTWYFALKSMTPTDKSDFSPIISEAVEAEPPPPPLVTAGPLAYQPTGTAAAPTMTAIGIVAAGLTCGPATKVIGAVKYCQITRAQVDLVNWPSDLGLTNVWARAK